MTTDTTGAAAEAGDFLSLSALLTGFGEFELEATGVAGAHLGTLLEIAPEATRGMLAAWRSIVGQEPPGGLQEAVRARILDDPWLGPLARNTITLWYTAQWAQLPAAWRYAHGAVEADVDHVVSAQAYQEGLMWKAAGTHPMGARQPGYGTWALPPR